MKRLPRDPIRFDVFDAFATFGQQEKISLREQAAADGFVDRVRASVNHSISNEALLYGLRTQSMFEAMVASFGAVEIIKQEDAGRIYVSDARLKIPDFRLVLTDGSQMLVEVKNFYQGQGEKAMTPFEFDRDYLEGLTLYARLMKCTLFIAVHWAVWNIWTLVPPETFEDQGNAKKVLHFQKALVANHMATLGDYSIGTKYPLSLVMVADKTKPRSVADDVGSFTIGKVEFYCDGRLIEDPLEKRIATYLMFFGKWSYESEVKIVEEQIEAVEHLWTPEEDNDQGFEVVESLSGMFSTFYKFTTEAEGKVANLELDAAPEWGRLIPENYKGKALPLWRFKLEPS